MPMVVSMKDKESKTKSKDSELSLGPMRKNILVIGKITIYMVKEHSHGLMVENTRAIM